MRNFFIVLAFFVSMYASAQAPAPVNDDCASATLLNANISCSLSVGTVSLATQSLPPITCGVGTSALAKDVWFYFNATAPTATINVYPNTQAGNNFNVVVSLYSACNGNLLACADNLGNLQQESLLLSGLVTGAAYYISVYQYKNNTSSADPANPSFSICIEAPLNTGAKDVSEKAAVIFPNPCIGGEISIKNLPHNAYIRLYDRMGQTISYSSSISSDNPETLIIKFDHLKHAGIVLLQISNETNSYNTYQLISN